jgi:hypothetical protein
MTSFTDCLQTSFTLWPFGLSEGVRDGVEEFGSF